MSRESRRLRRDRDRRARTEARRAARVAKDAARAQGCCCNVEFYVSWPYPNLPIVDLAHDDWCPLLRVRQEGAGGDEMQAVIAPHEPQFRGPGGEAA